MKRCVIMQVLYIICFFASAFLGADCRKTGMDGPMKHIMKG